MIQVVVTHSIVTHNKLYCFKYMRWVTKLQEKNARNILPFFTQRDHDRSFLVERLVRLLQAIGDFSGCFFSISPEHTGRWCGVCHFAPILEDVETNGHKTQGFKRRRGV